MWQLCCHLGGRGCEGDDRAAVARRGEAEHGVVRRRAYRERRRARAAGDVENRGAGGEGCGRVSPRLRRVDPGAAVVRLAARARGLRAHVAGADGVLARGPGEQRVGAAAGGGGLAGGLGGVGALVAAADGGVGVDGERARDARRAVGGVEREQVRA